MPLGETERRAIEAVARHARAPWEPGADPPAAILTVAGRRIAVAVATVPGQDPSGTGEGTPRLRDDRVARRFLSDLEAAVAAHAGGPDGDPDPGCADQNAQAGACGAD